MSIPVNISQLLIQRDDARAHLLVTWGRIRGGEALTDQLIGELEGYAREYDLLTKLHMHAVADGTAPASLLTILEEIQKRAETRSAASEVISAPASPELDLDATQPPANVREEPFRLESPPQSPLPAAGEVF